MIQRWCLGMILATGLLAAPPAQPRSQAWVLALDGRGGVVGDLKPEEFQVKVEGKSRPIVQVKNPAQTADAAQSWVLVFEPIRDVNFRAMAFIAAADFLTKVPDGDRVFIVARGKDSLEALMPGFSVRRSLWAEALARVPDLLPESLVGMSKETLQGAGFSATFKDASDGPAGQDALNALLAKFKAGTPGWARGTVDLKGIKLLDRLNFDNPMFVLGLISTVTRETKVLEAVFDQVATVEGQKHVVVFSRCESDDLSHPEIRRAMSTRFKREKGDAGGPAESAVVAHRDMTILHTELKSRAVANGITLYSVAGSGQNVLGHIGHAAATTGGYAFPLSSGMELTFGQSIQVFGSRYSLLWKEDGKLDEGAALEITTSRKDVKVIAQSLR
jgi:hypothetical protein